MNTFILPYGKNLIEETVSHLCFDRVGLNSKADLSSNLVIFPGKRPAYFLKKAITSHISSSVIPPKIFSMDEFIDFLFSEKGNSGFIDIEALDACAILYDIQKQGGSLSVQGDFISFDRFYPIGIKIFKDIEDLYIEHIKPSMLTSVDYAAGMSVPSETLSRLNSISYFFKEFYKRIKKAGYATRSVRYRAVSESIERYPIDRFKRVIIAGFFALTRSEITIFRSILKRPNSVFLFQEGDGIENTLSELDIPYNQNNQKKKVQTADIHFYSSPDAHGQIFGLNNIIKKMYKGEDLLNEKNVIVLPSSDVLLPLVNHTLNMYSSDSYNISIGYPLIRTPIFGFFTSLAEVGMSMETTNATEHIYIPHYLQFVLHPYSKNIYYNKRSDITRVIFHNMEEVLLKNRTKKFISLKSIEYDDSMLKKIAGAVQVIFPEITVSDISSHIKEIHDNTIRKFFYFRSIGDFSKKVSEVLTYIYNNSTARLHPLFYPFSETFINALDAVYGSLLGEISFSEKRSYFNFFKTFISTCFTPFEGTPLRGLQILGHLETRNLTFERVFFLDVNEDVIPKSDNYESLIPLFARKALKLPLYSDKERISQYYFDVTVKGAKEVHLFFVENRSKEKSRFVERLLWQKQKEDKETDSSRYVKQIQYQVNLGTREPVPVDKEDYVISLLKNYSYSSTSLNTYLKCPLLFYFKYVLDLNEREDVTATIEPIDIGRIVHNLILKRYFAKRVGFPLKEIDLSVHEIERLVDQSFIETCGEDIAGDAYLAKTQTKERMKDFIKYYQSAILKRCELELLALEYKVEGLHFHSFSLKGVIDRVERRGDMIYIIDYKISGNPDYYKINFNTLDIEDRNTWTKSIGTIQLPFYILLYKNIRQIAIEQIDALFLLLGRAFVDTDIELPFCKDRTAFIENYSIMEEIIGRLLYEITDDSIPFFPSIEQKKSCPRCLYRSLCRL